MFLVFGCNVNVCFNFHSRQMQAGMQVLSAILFVLLFSCVIIEKAFSKITNMEIIFSAVSKAGTIAQFPPWLRVQLPFNYFKMLLQNFREISRMSSRVWCCNASLNKNSVGTDSTCKLTRHCGLFPVRVELSVFL